MSYKISAQKIISELTKNNDLEIKYIDELKIIAKEFPDLHHYIDDSDIRKNDINYRIRQNNYLKEFLNYLNEGNLTKANQISFL